MEYEYKDIKDTKLGDIVECVIPYPNRYTVGKLYIIKNMHSTSIQVTECDDGFTDDRWNRDNFKLIKTKPGSEAKIGDNVICIKSYHTHEKCKKGIIYEVETLGNYINGYHTVNFLALYQKEDEFTYPMWFKHSQSHRIYKYTSLCDCISVETGDIFKDTTKHTNKEMTQVSEPTGCKVKGTCAHYNTIGNCDGCGSFERNPCCEIPIGTPTACIKNDAYPEMGADVKTEKETLMKENMKIELTLTPDMVKQVTPKKPKTDLQNENKKPFMAKVFNSAGKIRKRLFAKTQAKLDILVDNWLQDNPKDEIHFYTRTKIAKTERLKVKTTKVKVK